MMQLDLRVVKGKKDARVFLGCIHLEGARMCSLGEDDKRTTEDWTD